MTAVEFLQRGAGRAVHEITAIASSFRQRKTSVLMLHSIGGAEGEFNISTASFARLVSCLADKNIVKGEDVTDAEESFAITFDDVCGNFYTNAFPLLQTAGIPFTIFVSLSLLDTPGFISTRMLREISESSLCTVGSHGINHCFFRHLDEKAMRAELYDSREELRNITGRKIELFAFPYGSVYQCGFRHKKLVNEYYRLGFGTIPAPVTDISPRYFLPRINVTEKFIREFCQQ